MYVLLLHPPVESCCSCHSELFRAGTVCSCMSVQQLAQQRARFEVASGTSQQCCKIHNKSGDSKLLWHHAFLASQASLLLFLILSQSFKDILLKLLSKLPWLGLSPKCFSSFSESCLLFGQMSKPTNCILLIPVGLTFCHFTWQVVSIARDQFRHAESEGAAELSVQSLFLQVIMLCNPP